MEAIGTTTFVLPQFLQSGRYDYLIEYQGEVYFHTSVVGYREEPEAVKVSDRAAFEEGLPR